MKENYNKTLSEEQRARLRRIRHLALDMDGTIYMENNIFPFTIPTLDALKAAGVGHSFLTNNPTKSVGDYVAKLAKMGIECAWEDMYTTPIATIDYIKKAYPEVKKLFMLGTPSMREQFVEAGFISCEDDPADKPDMLVVAFDTTLVYSRLCRAAWWAKQTGETAFGLNNEEVVDILSDIRDEWAELEAIEHQGEVYGNTDIPNNFNEDNPVVVAPTIDEYKDACKEGIREALDERQPTNITIEMSGREVGYGVADAMAVESVQFNPEVAVV